MERMRLRALIATAVCAGHAFGDVNYSADFQSGLAGAEWSRKIIDTAPLGGQRFLGQFGNDSVALSLPAVRQGERVHLTFDFLAIRTWDGDDGGGGPGPDVFAVSVDGGPELMASTFSVGDPLGRHRMSYPDVAGVKAYPSRSGAIANDTLGYTYGPNNFPLDATWRMNFSFLAPTDGLTIRFAAMGLQEISDESWGLDNVHVTSSTVPAPGPMALAGAGLGLLLRRTRR